jgi:hypothetical protein
MTIVAALLGSLLAYGAIGALLGAWLVAAGLGRIDPVAGHASIAVRVLLWPAAAALWPVLLVKWMRAGRGGSAR